MSNVIPIHEGVPIEAPQFDALRTIVEKMLGRPLPDEVADLARALYAARELRQRCADLERAVEGALASAMPAKNGQVDGLPAFERRGGKDRKKWESERVVSELVKVARHERVDTFTGEINPDFSEAEALASVLLACARFEWRVTALRGKGLDPDAYCESEPGRFTVAFVG